MRSLALLPVLVLAGCVQSDDQYPSLLPRAVESQPLNEPERQAPVAAPDPTLDSQIAELNARFAADSRAFDEAANAAEAKIAVARGLRVGSDSWLDAQTAMSVLDSMRAPVVRGLSEFEALAIARGQAGAPPYPELDAAIAAADAASSAQERRVRTLENALGAP